MKSINYRKIRLELVQELLIEINNFGCIKEAWKYLKNKYNSKGIEYPCIKSFERWRKKYSKRGESGLSGVYSKTLHNIYALKTKSENSTKEPVNIPVQVNKTPDSLLNFQGSEIRMIVKDGEPWWVGKDVCNALGLESYSKQLYDLEEYEKGLYTIPTPGGKQRLICINEPAVYSLIFRSRKPEAKKFKKWIVTEVLPSIRKTGSYSVNPAPTENIQKHHKEIRIADLSKKELRLLADIVKDKIIDDTGIIFSGWKKSNRLKDA